jgi:hypothetical protein
MGGVHNLRVGPLRHGPKIKDKVVITDGSKTKGQEKEEEEEIVI